MCSCLMNTISNRHEQTPRLGRLVVGMTGWWTEQLGNKPFSYCSVAKWQKIQEEGLDGELYAD